MMKFYKVFEGMYRGVDDEGIGRDILVVDGKFKEHPNKKNKLTDQQLKEFNAFLNS